MAKLSKASMIETIGERFELIVMTGHSLQFIVDEDELAAPLEAIAVCGEPGGHLVLESSNRAARIWETWTPRRAGRR